MNNHPDIQRNITQRIKRAEEFIETTQLDLSKHLDSIRVLIDPQGDIFENTYQSWPDKYYISSKDKKILKKSEYSMDAIIIEDYANFLYKELTKVTEVTNILDELV